MRNTNEVVVIDTEKYEVMGTYPLKMAGANHPLALDEANHRIALLSPRPGRIEALIEVDAPRPRALDIQATAAFQRIAADLRARLGRTA